MLKVGLTGGIGAGKSTVAARLVELGAQLIDSDVLARAAIAPGSDGLAEAIDAFGRDILAADGAVDRAALAQVVFSDPRARARLEGIIHPRVRAGAEAAFRAAPNDAIVVNDVPLLAETGLAPTFDLVIVVEAPVPVRLDRLTGRGIPADQAIARIEAQADDPTRRAVADSLIDNAGDRAALHDRVDRQWHDRLVPFEANKRLGRIAHRPDALTLRSYDPDWPSRFRRTAARLRHAVGEDVLGIDHIGSTSVPGLTAEDVIDVQVTVADLRSVDDIAPRLATAGFFDTGVTADEPKPGFPGATDWGKRLFGGSDPGDITSIHVRRVDSPGRRFALLFRDWLRADPGAVAEYRAMKLATAATADDAHARAEAAWFTDLAWTRAAEWADRTGWQPGAAADEPA